LRAGFFRATNPARKRKRSLHRSFLNPTKYGGIDHAFNAVASVDLDNGVSSMARTKFNEELKKNNFSKHMLTTL
jgi:hypothetical protein